MYCYYPLSKIIPRPCGKLVPNYVNYSKVRKAFYRKISFALFLSPRNLRLKNLSELNKLVGVVRLLEMGLGRLLFPGECKHKCPLSDTGDAVVDENFDSSFMGEFFSFPASLTQLFS